MLSREGSSYTIFFAGDSTSRQNERFLRSVKFHEGACEDKNEGEESAYFNNNVTPLADSADAAPAPAAADLPSSSDGGGEKWGGHRYVEN